MDFGFSKRLEPGCKTWTFCGTPGNHSKYFQLNYYLKNIFRVRGAGDHPQQGPRQVRGLLVSRDPDVRTADWNVSFVSVLRVGSGCILSVLFGGSYYGSVKNVVNMKLSLTKNLIDYK